MLFDELRTLDFDAETDSGGATLETEEDVTAYLDRFTEDDSAGFEGETPTSGPEPSVQAEPTSEQEPVSPEPDPTPATEPPAQAEPTSEPEPSEPAKKLYAGKYHTVEDMEAGIRQSDTEARRLNQRITDLEAGQVKPEPETEAEPATVEAEEGLSLDDKKINDMFYDKSPVEAIRYVNSIAEAESIKKQTAEYIKTSETEAADFNKSLGQERARELVVKAATDAKLSETEISKLSNENNLITEEILEKFPAAAEQLYAEIDYVNDEFARQPITRNGEVVSTNGKYRKDAFKNANTILNHEKIVADTHLKASENTVKAIKDAEPGVKVMTPTEESHAEVGVTWTGNETQAEATEKAGQMSQEDVGEALDNWPA
jgi:hypothetical protein